MTDELRKAYEILELEPGASVEEIRTAYRDLVKVWHPDRYQNEPERLRLRAEERVKKITWAYDRLAGQGQAGSSADPILMDFGTRWGYINEKGETVIHPQFDDARAFHEGLAAVRMIDKWGFVDGQGQFPVSPLYDECGDFSEGVAAVKWYGRWGYVDKTGAFTIRPQFQMAGPFRGGWAEVRLGARVGRISRDGELQFSDTAGRRIEY
jgi:hypothetical protein